MVIMNKYKIFKWLIIFIVIPLFNQLFADQRVSGEVRGIWSQRLSPWIVVGNITLRAQDSLIIEPGVTVRFAGNFRFDVSGVLIAIGTEQDSIYIISDDMLPGSWRQISLSGIGTRGSRFSYCVIRSAYRGIEVTDCDIIIECSRISNCDNAAIRLVRSSSQVINCDISQINSTGIAITSQSRANITNCKITQCGNYGLGVVENSVPTLSKNIIIGANDCGIYLNGAGAVIISENIIDIANTRGIYVWESNNVQMTRNIVLATNGPGIWIYRSANLTLSNNNIIQSNQYGIYFSSSSATVVNNIIIQSRSSGIFSDRSSLTMCYNDVWANFRDYEGVEPGFNDISGNPLFTNPSEYDFCPMENSPVIDAGDPGTPRDPDGTRADIGAVFRNQNHPPVITDWVPDTLDFVNGDTEVDFSVTAEDADGHGLRYTWLVNNIRYGEGQQFRYLFNRDGDYTVKVIVDDGFYLGTTEHIWQFTVRGSGVKSELMPRDFYISGFYPNPFNQSSKIIINTKIPAILSIKLYDLWGRLVSDSFFGYINAGNHQYMINSDKYTNGEYLVEIQINNKQYYQKLIIIK